MPEMRSGPLFVSDTAVPGLEVLGAFIEILIPGAATGGAFSLIRDTWPPGAGPRLHVHRHEDELFHILEGSFAYWCGGDVYRGGAGSTIYLPRRIPHAFVNAGTAPARQLGLFCPGGFEQMFAEVAERGLQLPGDRDVINELQNACYGLEVLGPNPLVEG